MDSRDPRLRVCVMSGGDEVRYRCYINHSIYARLHDFVYHIGIGLGHGVSSPYYYKFNAVREILPHFDWVLYLDDDVYITDFTSERVESLIAEAQRDGHFLVAAEGAVEENGMWSRINSGVLLLRNDPRSFDWLDRAQGADLERVRDAWSDDEDGLFTNGDQDAMWQLLRDDARLRVGARIVEHRLLNSRPRYYQASLQDAFAVHFCGMGDKRLRIAKFGKRFGLGQELVPPELLDHFSVQRREQLGEGEKIVRELGDRRRDFQSRLRRKVDFVKTEGRWR